MVAGLAVPTGDHTVDTPFRAVVDCKVPPAGAHEIVSVLPERVKLRVGPEPPIAGVIAPTVIMEPPILPAE